MTKLLRLLTAAAILACGTSPSVLADGHLSLLGAWESADGAILVIEPQRLHLKTVEEDSTLGILAGDGLRLLVLDTCAPAEVTLRVETDDTGRRLQVDGTPALAEAGSFWRKETPPAVPSDHSIEIPDPVPLPEDEKQAISSQLVSFFEREQRLLKDGSTDASLETLQAEIESYLRELVQRIGWIDVERFGTDVAYKAAVLVKHVAGLHLRSAVLPSIEEDFAASGDDAMAFAIVYDSIQLDLGNPQRFGTQMGEDAEGDPIVCVLESSPKLPEFRQSIGLPPISAYLDLASRELYDGREVGIPGDASQLAVEFLEQDD